MNQSEFYKAPLYLELHRFRTFDWSRGIDRGFNLSLAELRALTALTRLLAETGYRGDEPGERITLKDWKSMGETPVLSFSWTDYLRVYYGGEGKGRQGQQAQRAKRALFDLGNKRLELSYYRRKGSPVIKYKGQLVKEKNVSSGNKRNGLTLVFHPIFIDHVHGFYVQKPFDLFTQICHYRQVQKPKKQLILFIEWLLTKNNSPTEISEDNLIKRLWLEPLRLARKRSRVAETLQECIETAQGLGYLSAFSKRRAEISQKEGEIFSFVVNPELCKRVKQPKDQTDSIAVHP